MVLHATSSPPPTKVSGHTFVQWALRKRFAEITPTGADRARTAQQEIHMTQTEKHLAIAHEREP